MYMALSYLQKNIFWAGAPFGVLKDNGIMHRLEKYNMRQTTKLRECIGAWLHHSMADWKIVEK